MSCCGGSNGGSGCGGSFQSGSGCPPPPQPPVVTCCGRTGSMAIRLPSCPCACLPMCPPPQYPQCPCLCMPPPTCPSQGGGCNPPCGDSCGGCAPCCPRPSPCTAKVLLTKQCPKKKCCPRVNKALEECPDQVTWPAPPKIDMCCSTSCPPRSIDICYMKVCPDPVRCCPPNHPCGAKSGMGQCCNRR